MTEEERKLLVTDLCARLPYGVKVCDDIGRTCELTIGNDDLIRMYYKMAMDWAYCKPYLRPLSDVTEAEKGELLSLNNCESLEWFDKDEICFYSMFVPYETLSMVIEWFNAHHFDWRGLIAKGLALVAPKDMYEIKK